MNACLKCASFSFSPQGLLFLELETKKQKDGIHRPNWISVELFLESQCVFYFGQQRQIEKFAVFSFRSQLERKNPAKFGIHEKTIFFLHRVCCVLCLGLTPALHWPTKLYFTNSHTIPNRVLSWAQFYWDSAFPLWTGPQMKGSHYSMCFLTTNNSTQDHQIRGKQRCKNPCNERPAPQTPSSSK